MPKNAITMDDHLNQIPSVVRPIVETAREAVCSVAPDSEEVVYQSSRPRSPIAMWKLAHYRSAGSYVVGLGTFSRHGTLFFYRGRELSDPRGALQGSGKDTRFLTLRSSVEAKDPSVKRLLREAFGLH